MVVFVLTVLAVFRVARFFVDDELAEPVRSQFYGGRFEYFFACYWCFGFWLSGMAVVVLGLFGVVSLLWFLPYWFAVSSGVGLLSQLSRFFVES